jgi:hypothetical protein
MKWGNANQLALYAKTKGDRKMQTKKLVANILKVYSETTSTELQAGREWYDRAELLARTLCPLDVNKGAGVIAALSPRITWAENVKGATKLISAVNSGSSIPPTVAGTYSNVAKAWRIANGEDVEMVLSNGQRDRAYKVKRFYRNITGDHNCVTVDMWATKAAYPECEDGTTIRGNLYLRIEEAYQIAARIAGNISPRDLQAAVWVHIRGSAD